MTRSCGVPVLCRIRIAASPVQVGRPSWEGRHSLEDAISERRRSLGQVFSSGELGQASEMARQTGWGSPFRRS